MMRAACGERKKYRRRRRSSVGTLIKQAEKAGKKVASVTTADGITLTFGEAKSTEPGNPWLAELNKGTKQ